MGMKTIKKQRRTQKGQQLPTLTEDEARAHFEKTRWPDGPVCPHCGSINVYKMTGKTTRAGLLACRDCRGHFTVTVGTVMEDSHLSLVVWIQAFHLMVSSKKGMSALQLQRNLGLGSYKTAWHLAHRIREAMRCEPVVAILKGTIQADETYVGGKPRKGTGYHKRGRGTAKAPVMVLVETGPGGKAHSRHVERVDGASLKGAICEMVDKSSAIHTDELAAYKGIGAHFDGGHKTVNHGSGQYVGSEGQHTNTAESYFALLKRGVMGSFHHISKKHLPRYCAEFSFRWCGRTVTDAERRDLAVKGAEGKRLMFRQPACT